MKEKVSFLSQREKISSEINDSSVVSSNESSVQPIKAPNAGCDSKDAERGVNVMCA